MSPKGKRKQEKTWPKRKKETQKKGKGPDRQARNLPKSSNSDHSKEEQNTGTTVSLCNYLKLKIPQNFKTNQHLVALCRTDAANLFDYVDDAEEAEDEQYLCFSDEQQPSEVLLFYFLNNYLGFYHFSLSDFFSGSTVIFIFGSGVGFFLLFTFDQNLRLCFFFFFFVPTSGFLRTSCTACNSWFNLLLSLFH